MFLVGMTAFQALNLGVNKPLESIVFSFKNGMSAQSITPKSPEDTSQEKEAFTP